jgi:hypothetical protein
MLTTSLRGCTEWYTTRTAVLRIHFPEGAVDCRHCPYCYAREAFGNYVCRLTDFYIEKADLSERHPGCPIIEEENNG